ncbi:DUF4344 domain-containing metallopeptidase [Streptomyces bobili]|uniref:DUF4344 domain-containing metallopeptidase n=1 Tax=Streptomyces bobili TaxID=67280 RepID=UPI00225A6592|nr:DUF4344 domain-containing metallopeptidase [Streptomyces bobili]MCX5524309.1 DUF4344 domain-containing metallopeptidase [Streptomyces bobili]
MVSYEQPSAADLDGASFLRGRKLMEEASETLDAFVGVGHQVGVVGRSCGGEGSSYDPEARRIEICYEEVAEERELFQGAGHHPADDEVVAALVETVFHEAGHALIDALGLSYTDRGEEDAADQFAALMLLRKGVSGERQLRVAAEEYGLSAAEDEMVEGEAADEDEAADDDEHAPDRLRAANHLCYLYGSAPGRNSDVAGSTLLRRARAAGCGKEWALVRGVWMKNLAPLLRGQ